LYNFRGPKGLFAIDWQSDGKATLQSVGSGRYVTAKLNGSLQATVDPASVGDRELFVVTLVNRPRLFLKCEHGFVATKSSASPARPECNRGLSDPVALMPVRRALKDTGMDHAATAYYLRGTQTRFITSCRPAAATVCPRPTPPSVGAEALCAAEQTAT